MNTPIDMESQWREYRDRCYPGGIPAMQESECRQAFYAGALSAFATADAVANVIEPEEKAASVLRGIVREVSSVCRDRITELKGRN